jgi:hypothetical protein
MTSPGGRTMRRSPASSSRTFHNGQLLLTEDRLWLGLHSLEPRLLELAGTDRVPVAGLATAAGWTRWRALAERAASELAALHGREPFFVHPLPVDPPSAAMLATLGGGAGFDLDALVTVLPQAGGAEHALVGDLALGTALLERASAEELDGWAHALGLAHAPGWVARLLADQRAPRARGLAAFCDLVAAHLATQGLDVARLPLLLVPTTRLVASGYDQPADFLVTWNNVVLERPSAGAAARAEGFSGLLGAGDDLARQRFAAAGYTLDLLPPLLPSVWRNGGYRCASQHVR